MWKKIKRILFFWRKKPCIKEMQKKLQNCLIGDQKALKSNLLDYCAERRLK